MIDFQAIAAISTERLAVYIMGVCIVLVIIVIAKLKKSTDERLNLIQEQANSAEQLSQTLFNQLSGIEKRVNDFNNLGYSRYNELKGLFEQIDTSVKKLNVELTEQKNIIDMLQSQQPEDRLYNRALKLVKLGATLEEIMKECDIPLAEAEILLSIHNKAK